MGLRTLPFNLCRECSGAGHLGKGLQDPTHSVQIDLRHPFFKTDDFRPYPGLA